VRHVDEQQTSRNLGGWTGREPRRRRAERRVRRKADDYRELAVQQSGGVRRRMVIVLEEKGSLEVDRIMSWPLPYLPSGNVGNMLLAHLLPPSIVVFLPPSYLLSYRCMMWLYVKRCWVKFIYLPARPPSLCQRKIQKISLVAYLHAHPPTHTQTYIHDPLLT